MRFKLTIFSAYDLFVGTSPHHKSRKTTQNYKKSCACLFRIHGQGSVLPTGLLGGAVGKTSPSNAGAESLIPGQGAKALNPTGLTNKQISKKKQYCDKFNTGFKNGPHF